MTPHLKATACLALAILAPAAGADTTLTDGTFNLAGWQSTLVGSEGNGGTFLATQQPLGGNPSQCHRVQQSIPDAPEGENSGIAVVHAALPFTHDPGADGPIGHLNMSIEVHKISSSQTIRFALVQDGLHYVSKGATTANQLPSGWNPWLLIDLKPQDFQRRLPDRSFDASVMPDFSTGGTTITFGYETSNATGIGFGGYSTTTDYDNFIVTIVAPPPCPGDIDGDGDTDVFDFALFAPALGAMMGDAEYNPAADLNADEVIDVFDFAILAPDFGCTP